RVRVVRDLTLGREVAEPCRGAHGAEDDRHQPDADRAPRVGGTGPCKPLSHALTGSDSSARACLSSTSSPRRVGSTTPYSVCGVSRPYACFKLSASPSAPPGDP